jgi:lipopolysaccharide/colanic/teichoic acid biosynthesis glycosyltransferase
VGRWLRRTSLDELPQLIDVVGGSMSLVGPRPHALGTEAAGLPFETAAADYESRHRVKPGITGWAQVRGWRGETDTVEKLRRRVEHDLHYIAHWSLLLDLRILALTVGALFRGEAY